MMKFSRTLAAGLGIAAAFSLAACHPPHQKDSDLKVENASTFTGVAPAHKAEATTEATIETDANGMEMTETMTTAVATVTTTAPLYGEEEVVATPYATEAVQ